MSGWQPVEQETEMTTNNTAPDLTTTICAYIKLAQTKPYPNCSKNCNGSNKVTE